MPASAKMRSYHNKKIRRPIVDGLFYPRVQKELKREVDSLLAKASPSAVDASALITPHAAFQYVGELLALAYKSASARRISNVILIAPLHRDSSQVLYLPSAQAFETPLGTVRVDHESCEKLLAGNIGFAYGDEAFEEEHSIEVQLPFIQRLFPEAALLPVLVGDLLVRDIGTLNHTLRDAFGRDWEYTLIVATTNMGSYRATESIESFESRRQSLLELIKGGKAREIIEATRSKGTAACGAQCIAILLSLVGGNHRVEFLRESSSEAGGPFGDAVVYYSSITFHREAAH
jgi:AmmeMemoRadiSam system protein B